MYSRHKCFQLPVVEFQSTRLSRASTIQFHQLTGETDISIHKALTSLDDNVMAKYMGGDDFNPQGSHEPRRAGPGDGSVGESISIHKALTSLDHQLPEYLPDVRYFNPQGSHEPRQQKYTIILASMPNLYILIIHLQQIIQQVKKFSRILILFSGRLQCESPWNFMCNYYSHQSFLTKNQPSFKLPPLSICAKFSRTILNNHLKWRSQLTVYPAVYYVLSRSKNSNVFT